MFATVTSSGCPKQQQVNLEEQDDLAVGGEGESDDGTPEPTAPPAPTLFPSSFGLRFCVDGSAEAFQIAAAFLDDDCLTAAAIDATHGMRQKNQKAQKGMNSKRRSGS